MLSNPLLHGGALGSLAVAITLGVTACGGTQQPQPTPTPPVNNATVPPSSDWTCSGNLVPPTGWEQETAFADVASTPNALQVASESARGQLIRRLCGSALSCNFLAARAKTWKTGSSGSQVCSMAVIKKEDLEAWRSISSKFDKDLDRVTRQLLGDNAGTHVAIDHIVDGGVPGGMRARWLQERMEQALTRAGAVQLEIPAGWSGNDVPRGVDLLIRAIVTPRLEQGNKVLEISWKARFKSRGAIAKRSADAVTVAADIAPNVSSLHPTLPTGAKDISIHLDTRYGGGLCLGETTQIWLHSKRALHVRVFDLYGKDGALLLFPNPDQPSGLVKANTKIALGGAEGFQAAPWPGTEVERFLVVAAPTEAGLGPFASLSGYCRMPSQTAQELHAGRGLPSSAQVASDGFRLLSGDACNQVAGEPVDLQALSQQLAALPECSP